MIEMAASAVYTDVADAGLTEATVRALVPADCEVLDTISLAPGIQPGDPLAQPGVFGIKWRCPA